MIEALTGFPDNVVAFACRGHVSRKDYDDVLVPVVEQALQADFSGIDPTAVWEDFKVGMEHILRWERVAVVTDVEWIANTMRAFSFLMPAQVRVFASAQAADARDWIIAAA